MSYMSEIYAAGASVEDVAIYMESNPQCDHNETFEAALDHFWKRKMAAGDMQEESFEEALARLS